MNSEQKPVHFALNAYLTLQKKNLLGMHSTKLSSEKGKRERKRVLIKHQVPGNLQDLNFVFKKILKLSVASGNWPQLLVIANISHKDTGNTICKLI